MTTVTITTSKARYPGNLADEFLALQAQQAELAERMRALKEQIVATGERVIEGNFARVTVSRVEGGWTFDAAKAKTYLSPEIIEACQKPRGPSIRFNCKAKKVDSTIAA